MVFKVAELITELKQYVTSHIEFVESLKNEAEDKLQERDNSKSWSVLECLEHLNLYAALYNPEINKRIEKTKYPKSEIFKPSYLGNKFAVDMLPKDEMKTMNTFKSKNPIYSELKKDEVLESFITFQKELLDLLELATTKDLTKTKTWTTLPLVRFRLGDTLRFVISHNERHIVQAKKVLGKF
ncbi:DinB family protein [uncultured Tenacibaculum sp.]|uniref:DinB family protein n=1 Tax=uncultured Tenacibaculum sp. TaxID=174713 RepID=UPI002621BFF5|nr:DinB family protein [uncultured Tenacibaculum sp.]